MTLVLALQTALAVGQPAAAFPPGPPMVDRAEAAPAAHAPAAAGASNGGVPAFAMSGSSRPVEDSAAADPSSRPASALTAAGPGFALENPATADAASGGAPAPASAGASLPLDGLADAANGGGPAPAGAALAVPVQDSAGADAALEAATRSVASALRCPVCQGLSIEDSPTELAREMRAVVRQQLAAGRTAEEVEAYFVSKYGEWILLEPEPHGFNLAIYLLPLAALLGGGGLIAVVVRRWTKPSAGAGEPRDDATEADPGFRAGV